MQSPFEIFRKHQRALITTLAIMIMVLFGMGTVLTQWAGQVNLFKRDVPPFVESSLGEFTKAEIEHLLQQRNVADRFIDEACRTAQVPFQFSMIYRFGRGRTPDQRRREVFLGYLLQQEAEMMGILVSDDAVRDFIDLITSGKLSAQQFQGIVDDMEISDKQLFRCLRAELQSRTAALLLQPSNPQTPEKYWKFYRRLHVRQSMDVAAIPVEAFLASIANPKEMETFFDAHKNDFEDKTEGKMKPGFKQFRKVELQYVQIPFEEIRTQVEKENPVTDAEIEEYYETNKDEKYRELDLPGLVDEDAPIDAEFAPEDGEVPIDAEFAPEKKEAEPKEGENTAKPDGGKEEDPEKPVKDDEEQADSDSDADDDQLDDELDGKEAPAADSEPAKSEKDSEPKQPQTDSKADEKPADEKSTDEKSTDEKSTDEKPADEKPADEKPADEGSADDKEKTDGEKDAEKTDVDKPEPKYEPLDEDLKEQIRTVLLDERVRTAIDEKATELIASIATDLGDDYNSRLDESLDSDSDRMGPSQAVIDTLAAESASALQKLAASAGAEYGTTGLLTAGELLELDDDSIGRTSEPDDPSRARTLLNLAFENESLYRAQQTENSLTSDRFVFWKVGDVAAHVPAWDELGIQAEVKRVMKTRQARVAAAEHAEQVAATVRESKQDFAEAVSGQTETGAKDSIALTARETPSFSWMRESTAPSGNPFAPREVMLSEVPFVERAGEQFMETVFEKFKAGDVGVAVNADETVFYVVHVKTRIGADREEFFMDFSSPFAQISAGGLHQMAARERQQMAFEWRRKLIDKYEVKWKDDEGN